MPITPERRMEAISTAMTFDAFVASSAQYGERMRHCYGAAVLDANDGDVLARLPEPVDVLVLVEDGCSDVVASLPVIARIADETPAVRLHVLIRDDASRDIADTYLKEGHSRIPTFIFGTDRGEETGHIIERTPPIEERVEGFLQAFFERHPDLDRNSYPQGASKETQGQLLASFFDFRHELRHVERKSLIDALLRSSEQGQSLSPGGTVGTQAPRS